MKGQEHRLMGVVKKTAGLWAEERGLRCGRKSTPGLLGAGTSM